jgi:hypothetical protein
MATQRFDELNILKRRSEPYEQYFGVMALTDKQKRDRIALALELEDILMIYFDLFQTTDKITAKQEFVYMLYEKVADGGFFDSEEEQDAYVTRMTDIITENTEKNLAEHPNDVSEYDVEKDELTPYWVSDDRAMFIAEDEANTLFNSKEYVEAKAKGYTHKIWVTYGDDRVRPTHIEVGGARIPIGSYFDVGKARMLYPKDVTSEFSTGIAHPEEVISCRCSLTYV